MRMLAHLSDLHFGRTDKVVVEALLADLHRHAPDRVVISGDLTQRARSAQFAEARAFIDRLPAPALIVPGNHDIAPLYRPLKRLLNPREKFQQHLPGHHPMPVFRDERMVVMGLDSTRRTRWKDGKLRSRHLDHVEDTLADTPEHSCRVAFMHHPLESTILGHPFEALAERGVDLVLTGHVHKTHIEIIQAPSNNCILVQASTACSTRLRDDANGYCLIRIAMPKLDIVVQGWSGSAFHTVHHLSFVKDGGLWRKTERG